MSELLSIVTGLPVNNVFLILFIIRLYYKGGNIKIMEIRQIQPTSNINSKARFINDKNGHFRKLWQDSVLDIELANLIDNFSKKNKKHSLEITDVVFNDKKKCHNYTIFNHRNGFGLTIESFNSSGFILHELLEKISQSHLLTDKNSRTATLYQKLTGQNSIFNKIFKG